MKCKKSIKPFRNDDKTNTFYFVNTNQRYINLFVNQLNVTILTIVLFVGHSQLFKITQWDQLKIHAFLNMKFERKT